MYPLFEKYIKEIFVSYVKGSYNYPAHFHNHIEIVYCFSGVQQIKAYGQIYTLKKGDAFVVFPNVAHEYIKCTEHTDERLSPIKAIVLKTDV